MKNILLFLMLMMLVSCENEIYPVQDNDGISIQEQTGVPNFTELEFKCLSLKLLIVKARVTAPNLK